MIRITRLAKANELFLTTMSSKLSKYLNEQLDVFLEEKQQKSN